ncbi:MAG: DUF1003 domain-containing protein [Candidatus Pacebacteria bacterium]|nr:DUF1003 domain-containing protein [Candidatus Paceibacterota bacterium]
MKSWSDKLTGALGSPASLVVHTVLFIAAFILPFFGISIDRVLLVLTTVVSLEAIYLALFIQMTVNRNTESLEDLEEDIEEVQEDIGELGEEIGEITEDLGEITEDIDEIYEEDAVDDLHDERVGAALANIQTDLTRIMGEIERLKEKRD